MRTSHTKQTKKRVLLSPFLLIPLLAGCATQSGANPTSNSPVNTVRQSNSLTNGLDESSSGATTEAGSELNVSSSSNTGPEMSQDNGSGAHSTALSQKAPGLSLEWLNSGNNLWGDRISLDTRLTATTASVLKEAYDTNLPGPPGGNESYPLEQGGVLYVTTRAAQVVAMNVQTGKTLWTYTPPAPSYHLPQTNRGVGLGDGNVYVLSADDYLVALNQQTGKLVFLVQVANPAEFYFESMAPLVADGRVIVGSAGGDEGIRGFVVAYDAHSGKKLWQFYTVPPRGVSWMPATGNHGGGAVWTTPCYDPDTKIIYFGTGNPSPDYFGKARPGPNPYTDSVVALNIETGKLQFAVQEVAHDLWDYDVASPPLLFRDGGQTVVGEAGKDGEWYEWNASTGKPLIAPVAFVKEEHSPPTTKGTQEWPGADGGANYGPSAFNPITHLVYVAGINGPETIYAGPEDHNGLGVDLGTHQNPAPTSQWTGTITAINPTTGSIAWQVTTPTPPIGGVTASAGGLLWYGQANGWLTAVSAKDGSLVWHQNLSGPIGAAPIVYQWQGHTYVTVLTGGATSLATLFPYHGPAHVITFTLPNP